jgi:hypothetical protein
MTSLPGATEPEIEVLDAWSAKLVREPLQNAPVDVICISSDSESTSAEKSSGVETVRRKGRLGNVIYVYVDDSIEIGPAIQSAIAQVQSPLVVLTEASSEWNRDIIDRLLRAIDGCDLAIGARPTSKTLAKCNRTISAKIRGWIWGAGVLDPLSPFKMARSEFLKKFPIQSKSYFAHVETIAKCNFLDALIHEELLPAAPAWTFPSYGRKVSADRRALFRNPHFKMQLASEIVEVE